MTVDTKKNFPLRDAYPFAAANGFVGRATEIKDMEIEWDRPYTSSVRRGRMIRLLQQHSLLEKFIQECWPTGSTSAGEIEIRRCLRIVDQYDAYINGEAVDVPVEPVESTVASLEFAVEAHLRDFLAKNLDRIEPGLRLAQIDGRSGVEYSIDGGRIDLLVIDGKGKYVVVELKVSQGRNRALGQLLYYMGWVDKILGKGPCRGIVIANDISGELLVAVSRTPGVSLFKYNMSFAVEMVQ